MTDRELRIIVAAIIEAGSLASGQCVAMTAAECSRDALKAADDLLKRAPLDPGEAMFRCRTAVRPGICRTCGERYDAGDIIAGPERMPIHGSCIGGRSA